MNKIFEALGIVIGISGLILLVLGASAPSAAILRDLLRDYSITGSTWSGPELEKLQVRSDGRYRAIRFMDTVLDESDVTLTFRQADLAFYSSHRYRSHLDPDLIPAFSARSPAAALAKLRAENISHLLVPPYAIPAIYASPIAKLVGDPCLVTLVQQHQGYRLFALNPGGCAVEGKPAFVLSDYQELEFTAAVLDRTWPIGTGSNGYELASTPGLVASAFVELVMCSGPLDFFSRTCPVPEQSPHESGTVWLAELDWMLEGQVDLVIHTYDEGGRYVGAEALYGVVGSGKQRRDHVLFALPPATRWFRLGATISSRAHVSIRDIVIKRTNIPLPLWHRQARQAWTSGWRINAGSVPDDVVEWGSSESANFLIATDGRPYRLFSPPTPVQGLPDVITLDASGVGSLEVILLVQCMFERCDLEVPLGSTFLTTQTATHRFEVGFRHYSEAVRAGDIQSPFLPGDLAQRLLSAAPRGGLPGPENATFSVSLDLRIQKDKRFRFTPWYDGRISVDHIEFQ